MVRRLAEAEFPRQTFGSPQVAVQQNPDFSAFQERVRLTGAQPKMAIVLVGLPGRGKSFISQKMSGLLSWKGISVRVFNVGSYRRKAVGAKESARPDFYSVQNVDAAKLRQQLAMQALDDMIAWLCESESQAVALFDATNSTEERRRVVLERCRAAKAPIAVMFVESICDDPEIIMANVRNKVAVSPDFEGLGQGEAMQQLSTRISNYEAVYETIRDDSLSYIKVFNLSSKVLANKVYGRVNKAILPALMAWNISTRPIWLVRCGRPVGAVGGSETAPYISDRGAELSPEGVDFARELSKFVTKFCVEYHQANSRHHHKEGEEGGDGAESARAGANGNAVNGEVRLSDGRIADRSALCKVMVSTLPRTLQTAEVCNVGTIEQFPHFNPLDKGEFHDISMEEIARRDPEWYEEWRQSPFDTRFPGGESYADVVNRLEPCVVDMEQQVVPVLVVGHVSVLQVLTAYFTRTPVTDIPKIRIPMNTVVQMTPMPSGEWHEKRFALAPQTGIPGFVHGA